MAWAHGQPSRASIFLLLAALQGCGGGVSSPQSVVVISIDTLRADRLGCYGNPAGLTPNLDRLAAGGVLFEDVTAPTPVTLPSHASLFTGRYPTETGVRNNGTFVLPDEEVTLAEALRDEGWETGAVIAAFPLKRRFGLGQGFRIYDEDLEPPAGRPGGGVRVHFLERDARAVTDRAIRVWQGLGEARRLLWVHYFDPHAPYAPPGDYALRHGDDLYDGEVAFTDAEIGRLLRAVEADDPAAVVVVVADHGEGLGDHGEPNHGLFLYQTTLHVPMLVRAPGLLPDGRRVSTPVSLIDVMPTLLGLIDVSPPPGLQGADLGPTVKDDALPERPVYAETYMPRLDYRFSEMRTLRRGPLKYVDAPRPELYDLDTDPGETTNLHGRLAEESDLAAELAELVAGAGVESAARAASPLDAESLEKLRGLGYLAGGSVDLPEGERGRDPKDMVGYFSRHGEANVALTNGRLDEGIAILRELVEQAPENFMIHQQIAAALIAKERYAEAELELEIVVAAAPDYAEGHRLLAETRARQGKIDEAIASFRAAADAAPTVGRPLFALGTLLEGWGRFEPAAEAYREAIDREPSESEYSRRLLELRYARGDLELAIRDLGELAAAHPGAAGLWTTLAVAERRRGEPAAALEHLERALRIEPHRYDALLEVGAIQLGSGRAGVAEVAFRRAIETAGERVEAWLGLASAQTAQGRTGEARNAYERVLRIDPGNRQAQEGLRRIGG